MNYRYRMSLFIHERLFVKHKINVLWKREAGIAEEGACVLLVNNPNDLSEVKRMIEDEDFHEFLVSKRKYSDPEWSFEIIREDEKEIANDDFDDDSSPPPSYA